MVCCGPPPSQKNPPIPSATTSATATIDKYSSDTGTDEDLLVRYKEAVKQRLLPDERYCGYQHNDDRAYNSSNTALDEFPWLVHVRFFDREYKTQYADRCNAVLINNRYVLTDAFCGAHAVQVKIGEYNTNQSISCDPTSNIQECNEPVYAIAVEEIIPNGKNKIDPYDFTLLRLTKPVEYSDFVRPICLPIDQRKRPKPTSLVFSGWGAPNNTGIAKKRLIYNVVNNKVCYNESSWLEGHVNSTNVSFICTSPPTNPTVLACPGDRGGPFMYSLTRRIQWYVEGIIVNVMSKTGRCNDKYLVNGIRITENTIDWILSTIKR